MGIFELISIIASIASAVGGAVSSSKNAKYRDKTIAAQKASKKQEERLALKNAMARQLDVGVQPYERQVQMPNAPTTTWSDMLQGVGSSVAGAASNEWAKKMFPTQQQPVNGTRKNKSYISEQQYPYEAV